MRDIAGVRGAVHGVGGARAMTVAQIVGREGVVPVVRATVAAVVAVETTQNYEFSVSAFLRFARNQLTVSCRPCSNSVVACQPSSRSARDASTRRRG